MSLSTHTLLRAASVAFLLAGGFSLSFWMTPPGAAQSYNGPGGGPSGGPRGGSGGRGGPGGPAGRGGGPAGGAPQPSQRRPEAQILSFAADDRRRVWLRSEGEQVVLNTIPDAGQGAGQAAEVARGSGWVEVAVAGDSIYVLSRQGAVGAILQFTGGKGAPIEVRNGLSHPASLRAHDGVLYWTETLPARGNALPFVPGGGPMLRLQRQPMDGSTSTLLLEWPGSLPTGLEGDNPTSQRVDRPEIRDIDRESILLRVGQPLTTEFLIVPLRGGSARTIACELGRQDVTRVKGQYLWTAPSREASPGASMVRICTSRDGVSPAETVSEWLPDGGRLLAPGKALYYAADYLYRIPTPLAFPERLRRLGQPKAALVGSQVVLLGEGGEPIALESRP